MLLQKTEEYRNWIIELKDKINSSQIKASLSVNNEMLQLYWEIGQSLSEKINKSDWGVKIIDQVANDLQHLFPNHKGFSNRNLQFMRQWVEFYNSTINNIEIVKQLVSQLPNQDFDTNKLVSITHQIPWGHNILIIQKVNSIEKAFFYIIKTIQNNWSRSVLAFQIENQLFERQGKSINNFELTLPKFQSDLAIETLKDPYKFDFLTLSENVNEKDIENQLINHISRFLIELGKGFAFIGNQFPIHVGDKEFRIDLLFYHIHIRSFFVIELKAGEFKPEYAGKLSFYLSAIDEKLKNKYDNPTIGLLLCKSKDKYQAEYSLRAINQPIGVSEYELIKAIPEHLQSQIPSIEDIENELNPKQ